MKNLFRGGIVAASLFVASTASAAVVSFESYTFNDTPNSVLPFVTVTDTGVVGEVEVNVGLLGSTVNVGTLTGLFFDFGGSANYDDIYFNLGSDPLAAFEAVSFDTNDAGMGANLEGDMDDMTVGMQSSGDFDLAIRFDKLSVYPTSQSFFLSGEFFAMDFTRVGLRFQEVGVGQLGGGSNKMIGIPGTPPPVNEVPLPAAGWMLMAGLGGLAAARRRRRAA
ncbi:hypothetical protein C1J03_13855 [Sulfitobacter sp. SK012]|uniref:VPLPA-CTERM sorting domain-containing protein n=1 Tax=Sulfitobacter sp. SK012 TaxID=1389005 RepID=UPI000E0B2CAF|nr:VPLPA-CTERM sorting domain-containing protein [Sulfitobacter sp. SK012]AXI47009.1 hypothetical protein C1J03_13855 [Sulfitobacter sp. SK012]